MKQKELLEKCLGRLRGEAREKGYQIVDISVSWPSVLSVTVTVLAEKEVDE